MIVIHPSRGAGVTTGSSLQLFDATFKSSGFTRPYCVIYPSSYPTDPTEESHAGGGPIKSAGPASGYLWLPVGEDSTLYEIKCQPISDTAKSGSSPVNTWLSLGTGRQWNGSITGSDIVLGWTIRDIATQTTRATCTITLTH